MPKSKLIQLSLPVTFLREKKRFVAYSPALDLSTSGKNFEEAQRHFTEIARIFLEEIMEKGTIKEVLENLGWEKIKAHWRPPIVISQQPETISIPVSV